METFQTKAAATMADIFITILFYKSLCNIIFQDIKHPKRYRSIECNLRHILYMCI